CGGGRHAFTAMRRGATVVALDYDAGELKEVRATRGAMIEAGEIPEDAPGGHVRIYRQHELEQQLERAGLWLRGSHHAHALHSPYWWLKCAYGLDNTDAAPVKRYHDFLCMCIERNPRWAAVTEKTLNPVLGKSVVLYGEKVGPSNAKWGKRSLDS
ncbi:MAG TPA: hypothetical protein VL856_10025, partial [Acidimicrobiia bacterium]|nr:hypothetical protein [Acidimicrobiia bacterium]